MRVPDPEDPKYWRNFMKYDASGKPYGVSSLFDEKKYIKDFRKWKAELRKAIAELNCASCDLRFDKPLLPCCQKCVMAYQKLESLIGGISKKRRIAPKIRDLVKHELKKASE